MVQNLAVNRMASTKISAYIALASAYELVVSVITLE